MYVLTILLQLSKAGLKFRAATITLLYRKSLQVNLATLSKFSMGEVANFMSTDTDRIANYTNSFHEFWSLPLQIVVALVLLYLQVSALHVELMLICHIQHARGWVYVQWNLLIKDSTGTQLAVLYREMCLIQR